MAQLNTMTITTFKACCKVLPSDVSVLVRGETGIGKSQITHQLSEHFNLVVVDKRLGQMMDGDIIGLPSTDNSTTRFNPPDWFKDCCDNPRVLFLDEFNRAQNEVQQAAFQIVLDRELNGYKLHPQTRLYAAINIGSKFTVNEMDPALLRRFWVADLDPTVAEWVSWAKEHGIPESTIEFIIANPSMLDPKKGGSLDPNTVEPTRHSYERLSKTQKEAGIVDDFENPLFYPTALGFLGNEVAIAYCDFLKASDIRVSAEDIIDHYFDDAVQKKMKSNRMTIDRINGIVERVIEHVLKLGALTPPQIKNLKSFATRLDHETIISMWTRLMQKGVDALDPAKMEFAKNIHAAMSEVVLGVFGVSPGAAGVGMEPKIPDSLKNSG